MKRRQFVLLLGAGGAAASSVGSGAFSSVEAERGVEVSVENDADAYIDYNSESLTLPDDANNDGTVDLVTIENQFARDVTTVSSDFKKGGEHFESISVPDSIGAGDSATITAEPKNISPGKEINVAITIEVEGDGFSAEILGNTDTRRFTVARKGSVVHYNGGGTIQVSPRGESEGEIQVKIHTIPNGNGNELSSETVHIEPYKNENPNQSGRIVAVEVDGDIYRHPGWNESACSFDNSGSGGGVKMDEPPEC